MGDLSNIIADQVDKYLSALSNYMALKRTLRLSRRRGIARLHLIPGSHDDAGVDALGDAPFRESPAQRPYLRLVGRLGHSLFTAPTISISGPARGSGTPLSGAAQAGVARRDMVKDNKLSTLAGALTVRARSFSSVRQFLEIGSYRLNLLYNLT